MFAGGAVWPLILLITWDRVTGKAAISGESGDSSSRLSCYMHSVVVHACPAMHPSHHGEHLARAVACCRAGAVIGSVSGITSWLVTAQITQGSITILNTEANAPLLAGNLISNLLSLVLVVSISLIFPEGRFDWELLKEKITSADEEVCCLHFALVFLEVEASCTAAPCPLACPDTAKACIPAAAHVRPVGEDTVR